MIETMIKTRISPIEPKIIWRFRREERFFAGGGATVELAWCMGDVVTPRRGHK
jgi:hypothetical protein